MTQWWTWFQFFFQNRSVKRSVLRSGLPLFFPGAKPHVCFDWLNFQCVQAQAAIEREEPLLQVIRWSCGCWGVLFERSSIVFEGGAELKGRADILVWSRNTHWASEDEWQWISPRSKQDVVHERYKIWRSLQRICSAFEDLRPIKSLARSTTTQRSNRAEPGQGCVVWPETSVEDGWRCPCVEIKAELHIYQ